VLVHAYVCACMHVFFLFLTAVYIVRAVIVILHHVQKKCHYIFASNFAKY